MEKDVISDAIEGPSTAYHNEPSILVKEFQDSLKENMDITEYPINRSETSKELKDKDNDKRTTSSVVSYDDDSMDVESNDEYVILTSWMNKNLGLSNILFIVDDKSTNSRKYNLWTMRLRIPLRGADYPFTIRQKYLCSL